MLDFKILSYFFSESYKPFPTSNLNFLKIMLLKLGYTSLVILLKRKWFNHKNKSQIVDYSEVYKPLQCTLVKQKKECIINSRNAKC